MGDDAETIVTTVSIPVVHEVLRVGTRLVDQGGATVRMVVSEREETAELLLRSDVLSIQRVIIGRVIDQPPTVREEDGVTIIPVLEEQLVVTKRLVLKEELWVTRKDQTVPWKETVKLREEHAIVEPIATPRDESPAHQTRRI